MESTVLLWSFLAALVLSTVLKLWLTSRQIRHVATHRGQVPAAFAGRVSLQAHQRAADYTVAKARLSLLTAVLGAAVLLGWTLFGGLDALNTWVFDHVQPRWGSMAYQLVLLVSFILIGSLLDLPFELYSTFRIEQQFGFNRMTWRLYVVDLLKGVVVGSVVGLPLAWLMLWIMGTTGPHWWLWAWGVWAAFNLILMVAYPTLIAPLFNKFEPLTDEGVKARVQALMQRCGFASKGLFVMDGSKRSAHGNAYFTGLGAAKRVVFFDTLLNKLTPGEVEAVLAHELGHFKHQHVKQRLALMFALSLAGFALLGFVQPNLVLHCAGCDVPHLGAASDALALLLFMLVVPVYSSFVSPADGPVVTQT
jgi:STE24 endopeptidase